MSVEYCVREGSDFVILAGDVEPPPTPDPRPGIWERILAALGAGRQMTQYSGVDSRKLLSYKKRKELRIVPKT